MVRQREKWKKLKIPYYPSDNDDDKGHYAVNTYEEKIICDYTGYTFKDIDDLVVFEYWLLLRDAVIFNNMQTEEGKEYLDNCWIMEQTQPDRKKIRETFKRGGENNGK